MRRSTTVPARIAGAVVCVRTVVPALLCGLAALMLAACSAGGTPDGLSGERTGAANDETTVDTMTIERALEEHTDDWMEIDGVEGTGIGLCDEIPCIKIFVSRPLEELEDVLPDSVHGHPVRLEPTGRFEVR